MAEKQLFTDCLDTVLSEFKDRLSKNSEPIRDLRAYVGKVASNQTKRLIRDKLKRRELGSVFTDMGLENVDDIFAGEGAHPETTAIARERFDRAIASLSRDDQELLKDFFETNMTLHDVAEKHGITQKAASERKRRMMKRFREGFDN